MNKDVSLFYTGPIFQGWADRLKGDTIHTIPSGIPTSPGQTWRLQSFLSQLKGFDKIVIHHHVEPVLAYYISKLFGPRTVWYSGSVFELPWQKVITGQDYRRISPSVGRTATEFYGSRVSRLLLSNNLYRLSTEAAKALDTTTVRGYGKILANSLFLAKFLRKVYRLTETPAVVYPGPDAAFASLSSAPRSQEQDYMLAVGSLVPLKNIETFIRAAATTRCSKIVLIGDGQDKSRLKDIAAQLDVPVEFRGNLDQESDLAMAYSQCKFIVLLSLYETFGLAPLEAALFSKPAIVTSNGGPPEVIVDGVTGFVVNPIDPQAVAAKMNLLLADETLRRNMGDLARTNVLKKFTLENSTRRLIEEIEAS